MGHQRGSSANLGEDRQRRIRRRYARFLSRPKGRRQVHEGHSDPQRSTVLGRGVRDDETATQKPRLSPRNRLEGEIFANRHRVHEQRKFVRILEVTRSTIRNQEGSNSIRRRSRIRNGVP